MMDDMSSMANERGSGRVAAGKPNDILSAFYRLSLREAELLKYCIGWAVKNQLELAADTRLKLSVSDFASTFGMSNGEAYRHLKDVLESLYKRGITLSENDDKPEEREVIRTRWLSQYAYVDAEELISLIFSVDVIKSVEILEKTFVSYRLEEVAQFSSLHALQLYELLQFKGAGSRTIEIEELREAFGLAPNEYKVMGDFKRRTVDVAVDQINQLTEWEVSYKNHKDGVRITALTFKFRRKNARKKPE